MADDLSAVAQGNTMRTPGEISARLPRSQTDLSLQGATALRSIRVARGHDATAEFWYSKRLALVMLGTLFLMVEAVSQLIPPFQSPDEFSHLDRAYLLSQGEVFLGKENHVTGGAIDTGLLQYMSYFQPIPFNYQEKVTTARVRPATSLTWTGVKQFSALPNTASYFPLPYAPQALALAAGQQFGLTVSDSYYLARLFSLAATLGLLAIALLVYPVPPVVLALLVTPMSLFQLGSASLDSVSFATTLLAGSLFMRGCDARLPFTAHMHGALVICLFSLASSRINMIALTPLLLTVYAVRHSRQYLISCGVLTGLSLAWIVFAAKTVKGMAQDETTLEVLRYYSGHPGSFFRVLFATFTHGELLKSYWASFLGVVGWLDTPLDSGAYLGLGVLLTLVVTVSMPRGEYGVLRNARWSLAGAALVCFLLLCGLLLVTWTPHPAKTIVGIQGRYFTPILILLGFAMFGGSGSPAGAKWLSLAVVFVMAALSVEALETKLLPRYWLSDLTGPPPAECVVSSAANFVRSTGRSSGRIRPLTGSYFTGV